MSSNTTLKYNPTFLCDSETIQDFVARQSDVDLVILLLAERDNANMRFMVTGPPGIGKTTFIMRIAAEVRRHANLSGRLLPVVFPEENYGLTTPGEFWVEALRCLAAESRDPQSQKYYEFLCNEKEELPLREYALAALKDFSDKTGLSLLLIVENFHQLLDEQLPPGDAWVLRHTFMNDPKISLLASAPSTFNGIRNYGAAMYEFFRIIQLEPFDEKECAELWQKVTGRKITKNQLKPLMILTGGNPRLVVMLSSLVTKRSGQGLMQSLSLIVDENTAYFRACIEQLPTYERKVFISLAMGWAPSSAHTVAKFARLSINKVSSLLIRLVKKGVVSVVGKVGRKKLYQLSERLFNIYILLRNRGLENSRVQSVVDFMDHFYQNQELPGTSSAIACEPSSSYGEVYADAEDCLKSLEMVFGDEAEVKRLARGITDLIESVCAMGYEKKARSLLKAPSTKTILEPLCVGVMFCLGEEVLVPREVEAIARDVVARIEDKKRKYENGKLQLPKLG